MKIEVSNGELIDKVTILSIKLQRIVDPAKLHNVRAEYDLLCESMKSLGLSTDSDDYQELTAVNNKLWDIENRLRSKESIGEFDKEFIELARGVYFNNDLRSRIKRRINAATVSGIVEEKEYSHY